MDVNVQVHTRELYDTLPYLADWEGFSVVCAGTNTGRSVPCELASLRCTQPTLRSRQTRDKGPAARVHYVRSDRDEAFKIAKDLQKLFPTQSDLNKLCLLLLKVMFLVYIQFLKCSLLISRYWDLFFVLLLCCTFLLQVSSIQIAIFHFIVWLWLYNVLRLLWNNS